MLSRQHEIAGWRYHSGPKAAESADHFQTGWKVATCGSHVGDRVLIWTPAIFNRDYTIGGRKAWPPNSGQPLLFDSLGDAIEFWHERRLADFYPMQEFIPNPLFDPTAGPHPLSHEEPSGVAQW